MVIKVVFTLSKALGSIHDFTSKSNKSLSQASSVRLFIVDLLISYKADEPIKQVPVSATSLKIIKIY